MQQNKRNDGKMLHNTKAWQEQHGRLEMTTNESGSHTAIRDDARSRVTSSCTHLTACQQTHYLNPGWEGVLVKFNDWIGEWWLSASWGVDGMSCRLRWSPAVSRMQASRVTGRRSRAVNGKQTSNAMGSLNNQGRFLWWFTRHYRKDGDDGQQGTIQLWRWDCGAMDMAIMQL